jgi:hypothetical protein
VSGNGGERQGVFDHGQRTHIRVLVRVTVSKKSHASSASANSRGAEELGPGAVKRIREVRCVMFETTSRIGRPGVAALRAWVA